MLLHVYVCVYEALVSCVFVGEHLQRTSVERETIVTLRVMRSKYFIRASVVSRNGLRARKKVG